MTMQEAAKFALDVQSASNLSGVVKSFALVMEVLWAEARKEGHGTEWVNTHPIAVLFATQINHLTRAGDATYYAAHQVCLQLVGVGV